MDDNLGAGQGWRFAKRTQWDVSDNEFSARMAELKKDGRPLFDLTVSNPLRCGLDLSGLDIAGSFDKDGLLDYRPDPLGLPSAREVVKAYYAEKGVNVPASRLLLTASTSDAYSYIFRLLCEADDEVLIPAPSYPLFSFLADISDVRLKSYALEIGEDGLWRMNRTAFMEALTVRTRAIIVVNPNNPSGSFVRSEDLDFMLAVAKERKIAIICDEVFADYALDAGADAVPTLAGRCGGVLSFVLSGISKILALPQMKLAWMLVQGPEDVLEVALKRLEIIADSYLSVNTPVMLAFGDWMGRRSEVQALLQARLRENVQAMNEIFRDYEGLDALRVEGGWYALLRMKGVYNEESFVLRLMEDERVAVHPGYFYDFAEGAHAVLGLLTPTGLWREGLMRLAAYHRKHAL